MNTLSSGGYAPVGTGRTNWNNYQDALNCAYTTTNVPFQFTCTGWQVHYDYVTDYFPRFGKDENLWAGFISATQTTAATFEPVQLLGGFDAISASLTGLAAALLLAF